MLIRWYCVLMKEWGCWRNENLERRETSSLRWAERVPSTRSLILGSLPSLGWDMMITMTIDGVGIFFFFFFHYYIKLLSAIVLRCYKLVIDKLESENLWRDVLAPKEEVKTKFREIRLVSCSIAIHCSIPFISMHISRDGGHVMSSTFNTFPAFSSLEFKITRQENVDWRYIIIGKWL